MYKVSLEHIQKLALIFFISSELCYYLLIAQTGIVESFSSDIYAIAPLPIGGIIGSFLAYTLKTSNKNKILIFLTFQFIISLFYPNLSMIMLFILGLSVGALAPLLINELKKATIIELGLALSISYAVGTFLFNYEATQRAPIAIILTMLTFICTVFLPKKELAQHRTQEFSLFIMVLWIFLDSALFESLSRNISISIWRDGFSFEIALFHIIGLICAIGFNLEKMQKELFIIILFALSYLFYFLQEALMLSFIYPFVISYYNVVILQTILKKDLKMIAIYMIFIGWMASGAGLFVALENLILFVPIIFLLSLISSLSIPKNQKIQQKELHYV